MKIRLRLYDYMRISGHIWTRTMKTQDKMKLVSQYLEYSVNKKCPMLPPNQAMWPSYTNVSHDKQVIAVLFECIKVLVHLDI